MSKFHPVQCTDSTLSIDLSKPEGISSFWNLFAKGNKEEDLKVINNNEKPNIKLNSFALKILKLKGINLTNINSFEKGDFHSFKQKKKVVVINPNQINLDKKEFVGGNMLLNLMNNQKSPKNTADFQLNVMPPSALSIKSKTGLLKSSVTCLRPNKPNHASRDQKDLQSNEKYDNCINLLSNSLNENILLKRVPEAKLKKKTKKRLIVPFYVGKKKSGTGKHNNLEQEYFLNYNKQNEICDFSSLITKVQALEDQLNKLQGKSKINKPFQFKAGTLISNKTEKINFTISETQVIKESNKNYKENIFNNKSTESCQKNKPFSEDKQKKKGKNLKGRTENFADVLNNPDILIKNHNLIIPGDLSEESLFQANPCAGCDTILKLFKALSEKGSCKNQPKNTSDKVSRESIEESKHAIRDCCSETFKKVDRFLSQSVDDPDATNTDTNHDSGDEGNVPLTTSDVDLGNDCSEIRRRGKFRSIFSLPVDMIALNMSDQEQLYVEEEKIVQETTSKTDITTRSCDRIFEEQSECDNGLKENPTFHVSEQRNTSVENLQPNDSQTVVYNEGMEKESDSGKMSEETSMINHVDESVSPQKNLNEIEIDLKNNSPTNQLKISVQEEINSPSHVISVNTLNNGNKCVTDMINLNTRREQYKMQGSHNQIQNLFKKTTISCPIKLPDQNVSITILIENDHGDVKDIEKACMIKLREKQTSDSMGSIDLNTKQTVLEKEHNTDKQKIAEETCFTEILSQDKSTPTSKTKQTFSDINSSVNYEQLMCTKNHCDEQNNFFGLINATYLTKEQREAFDNQVLKVDNFERSINLSDLNSSPHKNPLSVLKHESGLLNIFSRPCTGGQEASVDKQPKLNTGHNVSISHMSGSHNQNNSFNKKSFCVKKQSKTNIIQQDDSLCRIDRTKKVYHGGLTPNNINTSFLRKSESKFRNNHKLLKSGINNSLDSSECRDNSDSVYLKKRSCRFSMTLNQESLIRKAENNSLSFLSKKEVRERNQTDKNDKHRCNQSGNTQLILMNDNLGEEFKLLTNPYGNCLPVNGLVYKTLKCVQKDFNEIEQSQIDSHSCEAKLGIPSGNTTSNIVESKLVNTITMGSESVCNYLKTQLSCFQYNKAGNGIEGTYLLDENKLIEQNNFHGKQIFETENMLGLDYIKHRVGSGIKEDYQNFLKSDPKVICPKPLENEFGNNVRNRFQNNRIKPPCSSKSNEDKPCSYYNSGCLTLPDDLSDCGVID